MKRKLLVAAAILISTAALSILIGLVGTSGFGSSGLSLAAPLALTLTEIEPSTAPNDLDTSVVITGTDFVSTPTAYLGDTALDDVTWVSSTTLRATVPWGKAPGVYTLTVRNPDAESTNLPQAFTVTQGIGAWNLGKLHGGNVDQIAINPLTPTTVYAVSSHVGLFRSRDGGANWTFKFASTDIHNLAIDPITPTTIYWNNVGALYRSDDEGDTWIMLTVPFTATQAWGNGCAGFGGLEPVVHPAEPGTVFAFRCSGASFTGGLLKSVDHGDTWAHMITGLTDTQVSALVFHPIDATTMVLGTGNGNLFRSTDGGAAWQFVSRPSNSIMELAVSAFGAHEVWAASSSLDTPPDTVKSTNPDLTAWTSAIAPYATEGATKHLYMAPLAWGETYSGTVFVAGFGNSPDLRTADGGMTWGSFGPTFSIKSSTNYALHPTDPNILYVGEGTNGIQKTTDGGATWQVTNAGLTTLYPYRLATVPGQPGDLYALVNADREGIFKGTQGGAAWEFLPGVPGYSTDRRCGLLVDPFTPTTLYLGLDQGLMCRSDDGGQSWAVSATLSPPVSHTNCLISPEVLRADPLHPGTLLAGASAVCEMWTPDASSVGGVYSSTDRGAHWTQIDFGQEISPVNDIAYDALTPTTVYAVTGDWDSGSGMFRSTDSGQTWERVGQSIAALDHAHSIAVESGTPYRVFVWTPGWPQGPLHVSYDHGDSWEQVASPPGHEDTQLLCTHDDPSVLYAATSEGLYRSVDGAQSWQASNGVLGQVPVYSLVEVSATERVILYAGTTGGYVKSVDVNGLDWASDSGTLVNPGVYRYTSQRMRHLNVFSSTGSGDWNKPATWGVTGVPSTTSDVTITAGTRVTVSAPAACNKLYVEPGAELIVLDPFTLTVEGTFTNDGHLTMARTNASPTAFSIENAGGSQVKYYGLVITPTGTIAMGLVTVTIKGNQSCGVAGAVLRCYEITPTTQTTATIQLYYRSVESNTNSSPLAWHWDGSRWDRLPSTCGGNGDAMWVQATKVAEYSPFLLKDGIPTTVALQMLAVLRAHQAVVLLVLGVLAVAALGLVCLVWARNTKPGT